MGSRNGDFVVKRLQFFEKTYSRMAFISEFTNEIYDQSTAAFHEEQDSTRVFLGILVTLLPKIIPRIMPAIMGGDARIQEKFQDEEYITQVEQMFREKFLENLGVFENLIVAWQDNSLAPEDLGLHDLDPNHILAREDLIAGEPASFQSELLAGIHFLKDRMQRSIAREDDSINRVANTIWSTAITIADLISAYFNF